MISYGRDLQISSSIVLNIKQMQETIYQTALHQEHQI